jgi:NADPH:quinone reductase-like Zn-dependent oxidoreductase
MRAVVLHEFGPPASLVLDRLPDPLPGPGQALVAVELASVTFVETQVRAGRRSPITAAVAAHFGVTLVRGIALTPERTSSSRRQRTLSERALALAAAGSLRPVAGQTLALDRAGDAHAAMQSRATIGKTLLVV